MNNTIIALIVMIFISVIAGWLVSRTKKVEKPVKVMLFVLYFWVFAFIQLIVFALMYHFELLGFL